MRREEGEEGGRRRGEEREKSERSEEELVTYNVHIRICDINISTFV